MLHERYICMDHRSFADMPPRNSADDEDDFNPRFSSLRLHDTGYPPGHMMYGDPVVTQQSPYMYPPMGSPHVNAPPNQQYTPLQSPYLAAGPPMSRPGFPYAQSDMPDPMSMRGQMGYEYAPHVQPHAQSLAEQHAHAAASAVTYVARARCSARLCACVRVRVRLSAHVAKHE